MRHRYHNYLQNHVPPEVEEPRCSEVGALVVHLDGELLHLLGQKTFDLLHQALIIPKI